MKITFKDTSSIQKSRAKQKPMAPIPFSSPSHLSELSPFNIYEERPLKTNSMNLSFEGLSSYEGFEKTIVEFGKEFGKSAETLFREKINAAHSLKNSGLVLEGDKIVFSEKSFAKRAVDLAVYPFTQMPIDMVNGVIGGLKKVPGLKNAKFLDDLLNSKVLKNRKEFLEKSSDVAGIQHYFDLASHNKKGFKEAHKRFNPLVANYDTTIERTVTRIVTGAIPAFFLANDAYNLSVYLKDDKKVANKEKKRRFKQEVARIGITAVATYAAYGLFSKSSNSSPAKTQILMAVLTFVSEIVGRVMTGAPVLPVSEKSAKKYASIRSDKKLKSKASKTESSDKPDQNNQKVEKQEKTEKKEKKNKFTLKNFFKLFGLLVVAGFGVEKLSAQKDVSKILKSINKNYKGLYSKKFTISRSEFNKITEKLKSEGFTEVASKYNEIIKDQKGDLIELGTKKNEIMHIAIHQILTFPVRFAWSTLMAPYKNIVKPSVGAVVTGYKKIFKIKNAEVVLDEAAKKAKASEEAKKAKDMLQNSILFLKKNADKKDYKKVVGGAIIGSLDNVTKSNHDNADLASALKNIASAITSAFLIADNYNLVMINSGGKDKDLAEQKAKERTLQRAVRLIYGAFLVKFLNGIFAKSYNASLLGVQGVNTLYALSTETLERTSVGLPLTESSREEIMKKEKKNLEAKGLRGSYYKFMAKLTGKKVLSARKTDTKTK